MSFFEELKRRNVVRVGIAYIIIGWVLAQVAEFAFENFGAPEWVLKTFVAVLLLGLPLALFFAWAFEMTPEGIRREKDVDRSQSITARTGQKLNRLIIGVLVVAVGLLLADRFVFETAPDSAEVIATSGQQSIAVLPFANMSEDNDHFADGLSEELLNLLAKMPELKVAGRTSSFEFKGRNDDLREIGDALGVSYVLEGSVRRSAERLRITAQLIKVEDGFHVWSDTYDRQMADIFDIQDDVAGAITNALKLRLTSVPDRPTENAEAYALYLEALALVESVDGNHRPAVELLDRAIALDPKFARAYEAKAVAYWNVASFTMAADRAQILVYNATRRALELDPSLVIARAFATTSDPQDWSWPKEVRALEAAVAAEPDNPQTLSALAYDLQTAGYFREALGIARRHAEIDPLSYPANWNLARSYFALGEYEQADQVWDRLIELGDEQAYVDKAINRIVVGELEQAIELGERSVGLDTILPADFRSFVENASDPDTGRDFLVEYVNNEVSSATNFLEQTSPRQWLLYFGYINDYWDAIEELDPPGSTSWTNAENLEHIGMIYHRTGFARHPHYREYQQKYRMADLWDQRGAPDICSKVDGGWVCD